jgi:hypothetical protein
MPGRSPAFFEHFLNPDNHEPGIPLDMISYHFYASTAGDEKVETEPHSCFAQADGFLTTVRYIESIRKRLSPLTETTVNEIGIIRGDDMLQFQPGHVAQPIPAVYWNLAGAVYAYVFANLASMGIEIAGESQLVGYPSQFPSVSMVDWHTGSPNARLRILELLIKHCQPGGALCTTATGGFGSSPFYHAQAFVTKEGQRKLLLISKRDYPQTIQLTSFEGATAEIVDQSTAGEPARTETLKEEVFNLPGFAVAVLTIS